MKFITGLASAAIATLVIVTLFNTRATAAGGGGPVEIGSYLDVPLVSDVAGAAHQDPNMINPWGMATLGAGDDFWINEEGSGLAELFDGKGDAGGYLPGTTIPPPAGAQGPSHPTGIVANTINAFMVNGSPADFIFDTIDGTIAAWNTVNLNSAVTMVDNSGKATYTGLAMATNNGGAPLLYAANAAGSIDVFDGAFNPVTTSGGFNDPNLPTGLTPYGIANLNGDIFVTYAQRFQPTGAVDEFDPNGNLIMRVTTGSPLNQPWGMTIAPASFGSLSNDLLVGNFGDGAINAFDPATGKLIGQLADKKGKPILNPGLWTIIPGGNVFNVSNPNALYFTAGINAEKDGIFGLIQVDPSVKPPKPTPTPRPKPTPRPSSTARPTPTAKPTPTRKPTPTGKPTASGHSTPTPKATPTAKLTPTPRPTPAPKATPTPTATPAGPVGIY